MSKAPHGTAAGGSFGRTTPSPSPSPHKLFPCLCAAFASDLHSTRSLLCHFARPASESTHVSHVHCKCCLLPHVAVAALPQKEASAALPHEEAGAALPCKEAVAALPRE
eukprot:1136435-Pelagomonas_calceolata.AAC.6